MTPEDDATKHASLARFVRSVAEFLLYSSAQGYMLNARHLRARANTHFSVHASFVADAFREIDQEGSQWRIEGVEALCARIRDSECFADFVAPFNEEEFDFYDDGELATLETTHQARIEHANSLGAWIPPQDDAHAWLLGARALVPRFNTSADLAHWLDVSCDEFDAIRVSKRYRLRTRAKANGNVRLIEIPPESLRVLQRRLLHRLLDPIAPHAATHAYVRGRSVHTHARSHVRRKIVIRLDLEHFFPSISGARVFLFFRALGYRADIANVLTDLCVTSQSRRALQRALGRSHVGFFERYSVNHLPQGAPTSPALANLCAYSLDTRLDALAQTFDATYTRYADDLVFSGDEDIALHPRKFVQLARTIIAEEGFRLNAEKTRVMRDSARQSFAGLVVNERVNIARRDYDRLKAAVHRATHDAEETASAQLLGQIAWLSQCSPVRATKLRDQLLARRRPATAMEPTNERR
jgi:RNA-directed DNA polymerase